MRFLTLLSLLLFLMITPAIGLSAQPDLTEINSATGVNLTSVKGIGKKKAEGIISFMKAQGEITSLRQLRQVKGIGAKMIKKIACQFYAKAEGPLPCDQNLRPKGLGPINVNTAPVKLLMRLPGIGKSKASAIVNDRNTQGYFTSLDELRRIRGIGPSIVKKISAQAVAKLDINTAHAGDFEALGFQDGAMIISAREANRGFATVEDLGKVKGIDLALVEKLTAILSVSPIKKH
jgi:competence protein ComEA